MAIVPKEASVKFHMVVMKAVMMLPAIAMEAMTLNMVVMVDMVVMMDMVSWSHPRSPGLGGGERGYA